MATKGSQSQGPLTDADNDPAVDPTENVMKLVEAASKRQDDLREAERRYNDLRAQHHKEIADTHAKSNKETADLRARHQQEMDVKESSRLDSIRQVDREDVAKTAASANLAIGTLAKQTTDLATTLQAQVQATAQAAETRRNADMSEVNKRVSALELAGSASAGKQQVADPMQAEMVAELKAMRIALATGTGERRGLSLGWKILIGTAGFVSTVLSIAGVLYAVLKK